MSNELISALSGVLGAIIGAYISYFLQTSNSKSKDSKRRLALIHILASDIKSIMACINDDSLVLKEKYVMESAWDTLRYHFAEYANDFEEWELFESFYGECQTWNRFINSSSMSSDFKAGRAPLNNIFKRIIDRYEKL